MYWKKLSHEEVKQRIFDALSKNFDYRDERPVLGIPGTYLDTSEFYPDAPFLKDAAYGGFIYPFTNRDSRFTFKNP
jgi:tyrosine decarboxylase / aspartate 1-decarboxylase